MKKSIKAIITIILILFIAGVVSFLFYYKWILNTPLNQNATKTLFEVKEGESGFLISERLKSRDLIRSDWAFYLNSKIKETPLIPGVYEVSASMSTVSIYNMISSGDTKVVKVLIPEGYRAEQIAQVLEKKEIARYSDFIKYAKKYEGKLFPDTYFLTPDNTVPEIVDMMLKNYESRTKDLVVSPEDLIIASVVEREAKTDSDRALIAGVYKNRLKKGMKLESDPTVRYALDEEVIKNLKVEEILSFSFWKQKVILSEVRDFNSPYNTYYTSGLPPTPICNPGLSSINSAVNNQTNNYLYFINDLSGKIYPATTLSEHNQNILKYMNQ